MFAQSLSFPVWLATLSMISGGAGILLGSIFRTQQLLTLLNPPTLPLGWRLQILLMFCFLGGYGLAFAMVLHQWFVGLPILMGLVFFLGSLFVLFSINLYYQTLKQLLKTQREYRQAKEWAEASLAKLHQEKMSSLERTVAGIAHEINNPVTFIHNNLACLEHYAQALMEGVRLYQTTYPQPEAALTQQIEALDLPFIDRDLPRLLRSIASGTERIRDLILTLRNFARLDESDYKLAQINEGIDGALLLLNDRLRGHGTAPDISLDLDYGQLPEIFCNPRALNQVFLNLLENAIDALRETHSANPRITLRTEALSAGWIRICISDNGQGIPAPAQPRIFEPFFTTKPIGQGAGLGLSLAYQVVVKHHGGRINFLTVPETGTTFHIDLPIREFVQTHKASHVLLQA